MAKIFIEDAYCIGLLYAYTYANKTMLLKSDLDAFYETVKNNLETIDVLDISSLWIDNEPSIYYPSEGKNGEIYYVLYPDFDLERAKSKYIGCIPIKTLAATQESNALACLDLQRKDGHITRKDKVDYMDKLDIFLNNCGIEKCPIEDETYLTDEFILEQIESYKRILSSRTFKELDNNEIKKRTIK